jgi:hypothetical protein
MPTLIVEKTHHLNRKNWHHGGLIGLTPSGK